MLSHLIRIKISISDYIIYITHLHYDFEIKRLPHTWDQGDRYIYVCWSITAERAFFEFSQQPRSYRKKEEYGEKRKITNLKSVESRVSRARLICFLASSKWIFFIWFASPKVARYKTNRMRRQRQPCTSVPLAKCIIGRVGESERAERIVPSACLSR